MDARGGGATMTLEVDFHAPGREESHHITMPIGEAPWMKGCVDRGGTMVDCRELASVCGSGPPTM